jgi:Domain of unknown function (DUF4145)
MKCPTCRENTPDAWAPLWVINADGSRTHGLSRGPTGLVGIELDWMRCANKACEELVIRVKQTVRRFGDPPPPEEVSGWFACPRFARRPIDPLVPERYQRDYEDAAAILDISPRMSAVLSRRILADLLEEYAGQDQFSLASRIDNFMKDTQHPFELRKNLHYLREIADFSAHTQTNDQAEMIDVSQEEAEWTLEIVDRLFAYFIVTPERDKAMRTAFDEKLREAERKPIPPLPDEPPGEEETEER